MSVNIDTKKMSKELCFAAIEFAVTIKYICNDCRCLQYFYKHSEKGLLMNDY